MGTRERVMGGGKDSLQWCSRCVTVSWGLDKDWGTKLQYTMPQMCHCVMRTGERVIGETDSLQECSSFLKRPACSLVTIHRSEVRTASTDSTALIDLFFFFPLIIARHGDGQFPKFLVRSIYLVTVRDGKFSDNRTWAVTDI